MKILLLNPPAYGEHWHVTGISGCRWPSVAPGTIDKTKLQKRKDYYYAIFPFPLAFASAILREQGNETKVLDCIALNLTYKEMYNQIKEFNPDKVILESCGVSFEQDLKILENLHDFYGYEVCMVGAIVRSKKDIIPKYLECVEGNYIKHFSVNKENYIESLPQPDRDDTVLMYNDYFSFDKYIKKPQLQIWSNIGCIYNCSFCLWRWTMFDGKVAFRKVEDIKKEIEYCISRWEFKSVLIDDDTFNLGDKRTQEVAKMMGKLKIQWSAMVRADSCSLESFKVMKDNGCIGLKVGVETFSPEALKKIGKGLESEELLERILKLWNMDLFIYLSTMSYIFGETEEDRYKTDMILKELYTLGIHYQRPVCSPLIGTKMGKEFQEFELLHYGDNVRDFEYGKFDETSKYYKRVLEFNTRRGKS